MNALLLKLSLGVMRKIAERKQHWIFKRVPPRQHFARVLLAVATPTPTLVAEFIPGHIYELDLICLKKLAFQKSGMSHNEWNAYWHGCERGTAVPIMELAVTPKERRLNPVLYWGLKELPQNFCYVPKPNWPLGCPPIDPYKQPGELFNQP